MTISGSMSWIPLRPSPHAMRPNGGLRTARAVCRRAIILATIAAFPVHAQVFTVPANEPDRFRGQIVEVTDKAIVLNTDKGSVRLGISDNLSVFSLTKATFADVDFGSYVGAVSVKLNKFSPIIRDSLSYLHRGFELRIMDGTGSGGKAGRGSVTPGHRPCLGRSRVGVG